MINAPRSTLGWVERLLKPVVRFAIRRGLAYQQINEALKSALIEAAAEELRRTGGEDNISKVSVMSGLQRKDVKRLRESPAHSSPSAPLATKIIGQWLSHPSFSTGASKPKVLTASGVDSEFADLVRSVTADVSPYTVLSVLEQSGAVVRHGEKVELVSRGYSVPADLRESIEMLALDMDDLTRAVEENIFGSPAIPNLHATTVFDNVCVDQITAIRNWILDKGSSFHEMIREHIGKRDKDSNPRLFAKQGGARVSVCTFSIAELPQAHSDKEE